MTTPNNPTINGVIPTILNNFPVLQVPQAIDYTSKDFLGFITSMLTYANVAMPDWNTNSEGDMGVMIAELLAYAADILSYYGDRLTQEAYLPTATQRLSILNIAQLLGYIPSNGAAATGTVTFQTDPTTTAAVFVPAGTQVSTTFDSASDQPIIFQTDEDLQVNAAGATNTVGVTQGITYTMTDLGASNGNPGQTFAIPQTGVLDGSVSVFVQTVFSNTEWNFYSFLVDADAEDNAFSTYTDANGVTWIEFGDGINGAIPALGLEIWATYTVGLGSAGNVAAGTVGVMVTPITGVFVPFLGDGVTYNSTEMEGGADPETNDQIRANAPRSFRTQQRAVSLQDYEDLVMSVPGVLMSNAVTYHSTSIGLYVLGPNYQGPDATLQADILEFFEGKTTAGVTINVDQPSLIPVDVGSNSSNCIVQVSPNYSLGNTIQAVTQSLQILLSPPNTQFGMLLNLSDIMAAIMSVPGVQWCTVPLFTREDVTQSNTNPIQFRDPEIPVAGVMYLTGQGGIGT